MLAGVGIAQREGQHTHIRQLHGDVGVGLRHVARHHRLGRRLAGHQVERQQHRAGRLGIVGLRGLRQRESARALTCLPPGARCRDASGGTRLGDLGVWLNNLVEQRSHLRLVGALLHQPRQAGDQAGAIGLRRTREQRFKRLGHGLRAVQRAEDLQLEAQRVERGRQRHAPGPRGGQCLVARARLQRDFYRAAEHRLVARALRHVEKARIRSARITIAQVELAQQQLIEQRRVERRRRLVGLRLQRRVEQTGGQQECGGEGAPTRWAMEWSHGGWAHSRQPVGATA